MHDIERQFLAALSRPTEALLELDRLDAQQSLHEFVRQHWHVVEPVTPLIDGWALEAMCEHLEAVTYGEIHNLLVNVSPGSMKSLLISVFWPAWEWQEFPHLRYVMFSYAASLTERDNARFLAVIRSAHYQKLFGNRYTLIKAGEEKVSNDKTGWKLATSIKGVGTGERGDRVVLDDPHNIKEAESDAVRQSTVEWFKTAMLNRVNDIERSSIVVVMQRVHEDDVSGFILTEGLDFEHLMIPAEYDRGRHCVTSIGWEDPRTEDGEIFWPERFPAFALDQQKRAMGPYGFAGQYQQSPTPKGGGIFRREWWKPLEITKYPPFEYVVASLDTAYGTKQENDFSAMTVWGVWSGRTHSVMPTRIDQAGNRMDTEGRFREFVDAPRILLTFAWQERLALHELVTKAAETCKKFKVDRLLIEAKASGMSVAQEIRRLYAGETWSVQLINPGNLDKTARAYSVQHLFSEGMIYAPFVDDQPRVWAEMVITNMASFPRAAHDDLVDSATMALRHLRDTGFANRVDEMEREVEDSLTWHGSKPPPLYPGCS